MVDVRGKEIKVGQTAVVPFGKGELNIGTVTKITAKKVRVETVIPEFGDDIEAEDAWWEANEEAGVIDGTWYPAAICIIDE